MKGVSECVLRIPVGKTTIICPFTDGNLQSRVPAPATFATENPIVQTIIESCEMYKNKKIYTISVSGETEVEEATAVETAAAETKTTKKSSKKAATKPERRTMENVRTYGDAITVLMTESEVNVAELTDVEACLRKAEELGISFPNLK